MTEVSNTREVIESTMKALNFYENESHYGVKGGAGAPEANTPAVFRDFGRTARYARDALQALLDAGIGNASEAVLGYDIGAEQMRERCAKAIEQKAADYNESVVVSTYASIIRDLPLRGKDE